MSGPRAAVRRRRPAARRLVLVVAVLVAAAGCSPGLAPRAAGGVATSPTGSIAGMLAYVAAGEVRLRDPQGHDFSFGPAVVGEDVTALGWSRDGAYVAWVRQGTDRATVTVADAATGDTEEWTVSGAIRGALAATRDGFVVAVTTRREVVWLDPVALFAGRAPRVVAVEVEDPYVLAADDARALVAGSGAGSAAQARTVYAVTPADGATEVFTDGDALPEGDFRNVAIGPAALTADGRLVYATGTRAGRCDLAPALVVRDLAANRDLDVPPPRIAGFGPGVPHSVVTGPDGRTFAVVTSAVEGCRPGGQWFLYVLNELTWQPTDVDVRWGADSHDSRRRALVTVDGRLAVTGAPEVRGVTHAAWSPR